MIRARYGLIGHPIERSPSPAMHNAAFAACGMDATYELRPTQPSTLGEVLAELAAGQWSGLNITTPLKTLMAGHCELAGAAAKAQAVNTIRVAAGQRLVGQLTDVQGVRVPLEARGFAGGRALLLGAGGAARAAALALSELGAVVHVAARRRRAAQELVQLVPAHLQGVAVELGVGGSALEHCLASADAVIQATPVGRLGESLALPWEGARPGLLAFEMLYLPRRTAFLAEAEAAGARCIEGWEMLLHQGAAAWQCWTGQEPPVRVMQEALLGGLV